MRTARITLASSSFLLVWLALGYGLVWYLHGAPVPTEATATGFESAVNAPRSLSLGVMVFTAPMAWLVHVLTAVLATRGHAWARLFARSVLAGLAAFVLCSALLAVGQRIDAGGSVLSGPMLLIGLTFAIVLATVVAAR